MRIFVLIMLACSSSLIAQEKAPEVHLNHAFVVPDAQTYEAIRNSKFVKQFAVFEERTTHRKDITYTGFYLYGQHTYFEFLKPDDPKMAGGSDVAFGVDKAGDIELLKKHAEAAAMKAEIQPATRSFNGKDVNWFKSLKRTGQETPSLGIWTLEYFPIFLAEWNPRKTAKGSVRREDVLARYAEVVKQNPANKLMTDIVAIYINLPKEGIGESLKECKVLGFKALGGEGSAYCAAGSVNFIFHARKDKPGIAAVRFALRKPVEEAEYKLGKTVLKLQGKRAIWEFPAR